MLRRVPTGTQLDYHIGGGLRAGGFHLALTTPEGVLGRDAWLQSLFKREKVARVDGTPRQVLEAAIRGAEIIVGPLVAERPRIDSLWAALARTNAAYVILADHGEIPRVLKFFSNLTLLFEGGETGPRVRLVKDSLSGKQGYLLSV